MWHGESVSRNNKIIMLSDTRYAVERVRRKNQEKRKLSCMMAVFLGAVVTAELLIMGAMLLNIDFRSADRVALILGAAVLYFGVVASLTDK